MLNAVINIDHNEYVTNKHQYGGQPGLTEKAASRRMRLAGQGQRHWELPAIELVLWDPTPTHVEELEEGLLGGCMAPLAWLGSIQCPWDEPEE
ncbi:unnamed protein product [Boreogadus saida]